MSERLVFNGSHLATSMRSSGYRNTAYALAEIIDNSVEAKAKHIEVLCGEKQNYVAEPPVKQLDSIAIIDDGIGMTKDELWNSLLMGEGTRYATKGIGKFGVGLPNSSMSQCKNVTVYSWKDPNNVFSAYMDLDEVSEKGLAIKEPQKTEIPKTWKNKSNYIKNAKSGTIVIWSKIDKIQWKKTKTLLKHLERTTGRIYRKFIYDSNLKIRLASFDLDTNRLSVDPVTKGLDREMLPNDPLYQMVPSSTDRPWNKKPMFEVDGDHLEETIHVEGHKVIIRCTLATKEAREPKEGKPAGSLPHGKHANSNLGISLIRSKRELCMDTNICQTYDPLERWWGIEVEFPTELDDVFGVANTKQDATHFSSMTHEIGVALREEEELNDEDVSDDLRKLVETIHRRIRSMRITIKKTNKKPTTSNSSNPDPWPDPDTSPTVTGQQDERMTFKEKEQAITEALSKTYEPEDASKEAKLILEKKIKTKIDTASLGTNFFFDVSLKGGVTLITLNTDHQAYKHLVEIIEEIPDDLDVEKAKDILSKLRAAITLLFVSWAYYENHTMVNEAREKLIDVRYNWSRKLAELMKILRS